MKKYYDGIAERMLSEIETISGQMSHQGEKGRNNELVLAEYLRQHLPGKYAVTTGKVVSADGEESAQTDIIIHDRFNGAAFMTSHAWSIVPIESTRMVISVKTTLHRAELQDAIRQIESVRKLTQTAAIRYEHGMKHTISGGGLLRPRAMVFAFKSSWKEPTSLQTAFRELVDTVHDDYRPNAVCAVDQCIAIRNPYTTDTTLFTDHPLLHFFVFALKCLDSFPDRVADLEQYFDEYPG